VKGLLTQWYPVSDQLGPAEGTKEQGPLDLKTVDRSFLSWKIDLLPPGEAVIPSPPTVEAQDPWSFARAVKSASVRTAPRARPDRMGPVESEGFIFYRGLGTFALPVSVEASEGGKVVLKNGGKAPLPFAFVLDMKGDSGAFQAIGGVGAGDSKAVNLAAAQPKPKKETVGALETAVAEALVAGGLYRDEAEAMVKTWARAWFASEGTRVIYSVPRGDVDALLPLAITPAPDETVRVLVGRIEFLTPEVEADVGAALRDRASSDAAVRDAAMARLVKLDRFLEPHVRRVLAKTTDAGIRKSGEEVLAALKN
jgi:hypothetical protein